VIQGRLDLEDTARDRDVMRYRELTGRVLPSMAAQKGWPVDQDHCLQRIVLDHVAGGVWYDYIAKPAYAHLTADQAARAAALADDIRSGQADLSALNAQSLRWRGKLGPKTER